MKSFADIRAKEILLSYDILAPHATSKEDFEYAKMNGLMFDPLLQSHSEAMSIAQHEKDRIAKRSVTDLFLASLSANRMEWRAGLSAYAIMESLPEHKFEQFSTRNNNICTICCSSRDENINRTFFNHGRFLTGGLVLYYIYEIAFYLQEQFLIKSHIPVEEDFLIFSSILELLVQATDEDTPASIQKKMRKIKGFKSTEEQRRAILTTLGYCSILETREQQGFLLKFTNICTAPRKSRNTDWSYPIDWWTGKNGINKKAFEYWFGAYSQLENYWVSDNKD